jgi:hypothetical protein
MYSKTLTTLALLLCLQWYCPAAQGQNISWAIKPQFASAFDFIKGTAVVYIKKKYGLIDKTGKIIVAPTYNKIRRFDDGNMYALKGNKSFLLDHQGKPLLKQKYQFLKPTSHQLLYIKVDGKWGCINSNGKTILKPIYEISYLNIVSPQLIWVADYKKEMWVNAQGKIIQSTKAPRVKTDLEVFSNDDDLYGYKNSKGKVVIPAQYDNASDFHNGVAKVVKDDLYGLINSKGKVIIPVKYNEDSDLLDFEGNRVAIHYKVIKDKNKVKPTDEDDDDDEENTKLGLIDHKGKWVVEPVYKDISRFSYGGFIQASKEDNEGLYDRAGKQVLPCEFELIQQDLKSGFVFGSHPKGYTTVVDRYGKICFSNKFGDVKWANDQYLGASLPKTPKKFGIFDIKGKVIVAPKYTGVRDFKEGFAAVKKGTNEDVLHNNASDQVIVRERWGFVNKAGKEVIPTIYHKVHNFSEGFAVVGTSKKDVVVTLQCKYGLVDKNGKVIVATQFDIASSKVSDGLWAVKQGNKWGYIKVK